MTRITAVALALVVPGLATAADQASTTRTLNPFQPVRVEDASPVSPGWLVDMSTAFTRQSGDNALIFRPNLRYGVNEDLSVSLGTDLQMVGDEGSVQGAELGAQWKIVDQTDATPMVALVGAVNTPYEDTDGSGSIGLRATERMGPARVHANGTYTAQLDAEDEWLFGGAVDLLDSSERFLMIADAYVERVQGEPTVGADLGGNYWVGEGFLLQAAAGVLDIEEGELIPRVLIGVSSHM